MAGRAVEQFADASVGGLEIAFEAVGFEGVAR